jgi:4-hydroxy-2-oxoheptanedioate aldolase
MYKNEKHLIKQLELLNKKYNVQGIKAEFEAEGSSFRDVNRLNRICAKLNIGLFLKIGGPEAVRDIKDSLELGVAGLIAPMIESKFAAKKFIDAYKKIYQDKSIHTSLNIETKIGIENIKDIVDFSVGSVDNITIGRTDLTSSFFDKDLKQDSNFIFQLIEKVAPIISENKMSLTVGGGITQKTIEKIKKDFPNLTDSILKIETRKVVFYTSDLLNGENPIEQALKFEKLYILSKKDFSDMYVDSEISRLTELSRRVDK